MRCLFLVQTFSTFFNPLDNDMCSIVSMSSAYARHSSFSNTPIHCRCEYAYSNPAIYAAVGSKKSKRHESNFILFMLQSSVFLTSNLKKFYGFTVIPRFTSQLVPENAI